jgi:CHASE2 domain-containing sensor protein/two-component sensor histidine kinase
MTQSKTSSPWLRLKHYRWLRRLVPGVTIVTLIILARLMGLLEVAEWKALDLFLRWRPAEPKDERLLIVGINEQDIQQTGQYPIPDGMLAALITTLNQHEPRVIGVDLYRGLPIEPGNAALTEVFATSPNVIGIERIVGVVSDVATPPTALPPEQVGIVDFPLDGDGFVRRTYLGTFPSLEAPDPDRFRFSLALRLAQQYLAPDGLAVANGRRDPLSMRFDQTEFPRFQRSDGGYVDSSDDAGIQILINPRSGETPFDIVSMTDVLQGQVDGQLIRNRAVLIGVKSLTVKDLINSAAIQSDNPGLVYGVEVHAHVASQILSAVLADRPLIRVWQPGWEYLWIMLWGGFGVGLLYLKLPTLKHAIATVLGITLLLTVCLGALWGGGLWLSVVPSLVAFALVSLPGFVLYETTLRERIDERQHIIERTYDAIHNGPLQTLAILLQEREQLDASVSNRLEELNHEIRKIYVNLLEESLPTADKLQLSSQKIVDLRSPLSEVLYEVYAATLSRDLPGFDSLKLHIIKFEPLTTEGLSSEERRSLCRFLEEALCNVGKHANHPKRLTVTCMATETENLIMVADNGKNAGTLGTEREGHGTEQARSLARRLRGNFHRAITETGSTCEMRWPLTRTQSIWSLLRLPKPAKFPSKPET